MPVRDASVGESLPEWPLVELRVTARARETADVDEGLDTRLAERLDQLVERAGAVADRKRMHTISRPW